MKEQKPQYIRCPRCELNYILKKDKFCNVCKIEMKAQGTLGVDENLDLELCPICKVNYINIDEDMCPACAKENALGDSDDNDSGIDNDGSWRGVYDTNDEEDYGGRDDEETGDMVSITDLDDAPLDSDDDMELGLDDDLDDDDKLSDDEDETFDSDFDDAFEDGLDDDFDDDDFEEKPKAKSKKKK